MTKAQLKAAKAELKRLNDFIAKAEGLGNPEGIEVYRNDLNSDSFGVEYSFVKIAKDATELRKQLKAIRWGKAGKGKARWNSTEGAWSCLTEGISGTKFSA